MKLLTTTPYHPACSGVTPANSNVAFVAPATALVAASTLPVSPNANSAAKYH